MCWKASKYSVCSYRTKIPGCGMFQYNCDLCIKFILFNLVMWVPKFQFYRGALYYVQSSQVLLHNEQETVCLFWMIFFPLETKWKSHFLMTAAVIGWSICFIQCLTFSGRKITCELRSNTAHSATACVHFEENVYYVFLEDKMKICSDEVHCFLDYRFPDTEFSYVRGKIF